MNTPKLWLVIIKKSVWYSNLIFRNLISQYFSVTTCICFTDHKVTVNIQNSSKRSCARPLPDLKNLIEGWTIAFYTLFTPFFLIFELCSDRVSGKIKAGGQRRGKKQRSPKAGRDWKARPVLTAKYANFLLGAEFVFPMRWAISRYRRGLVPCPVWWWQRTRWEQLESRKSLALPFITLTGKADLLRERWSYKAIILCCHISYFES